MLSRPLCRPTSLPCDSRTGALQNAHEQLLQGRAGDHLRCAGARSPHAVAHAVSLPLGARFSTLPLAHSRIVPPQSMTSREETPSRTCPRSGSERREPASHAAREPEQPPEVSRTVPTQLPAHLIDASAAQVDMYCTIPDSVKIVIGNKASPRSPLVPP